MHSLSLSLLTVFDNGAAPYPVRSTHRSVFMLTQGEQDEVEVGRQGSNAGSRASHSGEMPWNADSAVLPLRGSYIIAPQTLRTDGN